MNQNSQYFDDDLVSRVEKSGCYWLRHGKLSF